MIDIKKIRKAEGLTQQQMAELAGVKRCSIARLESGIVKYPTLDYIERILKPIGYTIEAVKKSDGNTESI